MIDAANLLSAYGAIQCHECVLQPATAISCDCTRTAECGLKCRHAPFFSPPRSLSTDAGELSGQRHATVDHIVLAVEFLYNSGTARNSFGAACRCPRAGGCWSYACVVLFWAELVQAFVPFLFGISPGVGVQCRVLGAEFGETRVRDRH
jgi:hypothetical protein